MEMSFTEMTLHAVSQGLKIPVIILLIAFLVYAVCLIGSLIVEYYFERRHFKAKGSEIVCELDEAPADKVEEVISESGLLKTQKDALLSIWQHRFLDEEARWSYAKEVIFNLNRRNTNAATRVETVGKIAPMIGLLGTLIPLGPGIVALSTGETEVLASALLVAFDTTVAGLVVAAICTVAARIRRNWYALYANVVDALTNTELEKIEILSAKESEKHGSGMDKSAVIA